MSSRFPLRTPYHALGDGTRPRVPEWAQQRSVYRASGRTLYVVHTDRLDAAHTDLATLSRDGWRVEIDRTDDGAGISLSRAA